MKRSLFSLFVLIGLTAGSALFAQPGGTRGGDGPENEDLKWIFEWQRNQHITEIAAALALTSDQVATLNGVKAEVEAIKAEFQPELDALAGEAETVAAAVRANIEQTGEFSEEDQAALGALREDRRSIQREMKLRFELAAMPMENLLTEEQKTILAELFRGNRGGERAEKANGQGENGAQRGRSRSRGGAGERIKQRVARMLLSDAFLDYYNN